MVCGTRTRDLFRACRVDCKKETRPAAPIVTENIVNIGPQSVGLFAGKRRSSKDRFVIRRQKQHPPHQPAAAAASTGQSVSELSKEG